MLCLRKADLRQLRQKLRSQINGAKLACLMLLLFMVHQDVTFGPTVTMLRDGTDFCMQGHLGKAALFPGAPFRVVWYVVPGLLRSDVLRACSSQKDPVP